MNDALLEAMNLEELLHYLHCTPVAKTTREGLIINLLLERFQEHLDNSIPDYELRIRILEDKLDEAHSENATQNFKITELEQRVWELENQ